MIKLIDTLPKMPSDNIRTVKIKCCFSAYGSYRKIALFWIQEIKGSITALFSLFGGVLTISAFKNADFQEIKDFLGFCAYSEIYCDEYTANLLSLKVKSRNTVIVYAGNNSAPPIENTNAGAEYLALRLSEVFNTEKNELYADISHRIRHGCMQYVTSPYGVAAMQTADDCGIITGICTSSDKRRVGIGSSVLSCLLKYADGKTVFAECEPKTVPFYLKNAFKINDISVICERKL